MKKIVLIFIMLNAVQHVIAQNVGIGTNTPSQKLDVNGNINMSGNLQVNNVAGQPNQVLMTNGSGNTFWGDMGGYKNVASFTATNIWTIPTGVTKIRIEAWGGGGGGAIGGGGAGGTYILTSELTVVPAATITITIGAGGFGAGSEILNAGNGGNTTILGSFGTLQALGGGGGYTNMGGWGQAISLLGSSFIQFVGMSGTSTVYEYTERTAGIFVEIAKNGNGGGVAPFYNNGGPGGMYVKELAGNTIIKNTYTPVTEIPGSGGGGGSNGVFWGSDGMRGMVIIYY